MRCTVQVKGLLSYELLFPRDPPLRCNVTFLRGARSGVMRKTFIVLSRSTVYFSKNSETQGVLPMTTHNRKRRALNIFPGPWMLPSIRTRIT